MDIDSIVVRYLGGSMFSGIDVDNINILIRKNNFYMDSIIKNKDKAIEAINELNSSYDGKSLNYLFSGISSEVSNLYNIPKVVESYSSVLYRVIRSYQNQNLNSKIQINNSAKILNREVERK